MQDERAAFDSSASMGWPDKEVEAFTTGDDYLLDRELVEADCVASAAHARMLAKIGILTSDEAGKLAAELRAIAADSRSGAFTGEPTDEALRLVVEGMPFRDAYRQVAASLDSLQTADPRSSIAQRTHAGAPGNLRLELADEAIGRLKGFTEERRDRLSRVGDALFGRAKTG